MASFVLVHGAMGGAWCWDPVLPRLRAAGHDARAIDLPFAGTDTTPLPEVTLYRYAEAVCEAVAGDEPTLLAGHSMGGMAITQAAATCAERLAGLIYISAFLPQPGQSLLDITRLPEAAGDAVQANIVVDGDPPTAMMPPEAAPEALYHCCTPAQVAWALPLRGRQPVVPFTQPFEPGEDTTAFDALPRAYISCLQDRAIRPPLQRRMYSAAGCDPVIEIDTDHSPWLSATAELVTALDQIAARFT
ncbi:MAG: alpha/beta fold hydrolase [Solirubrobacteraceae bacterium]